MSPEDIAKIQSALNEIEEAQNIIESAARELCSVPNFGEQWTEVCELRRTVNAQWHKVDRRRIALKTATKIQEGNAFVE